MLRACNHVTAWRRHPSPDMKMIVGHTARPLDADPTLTVVVS